MAAKRPRPNFDDQPPKKKPAKAKTKAQSRKPTPRSKEQFGRGRRSDIGQTSIDSLDDDELKEVDEIAARVAISFRQSPNETAATISILDTETGESPFANLPVRQRAYLGAFAVSFDRVLSAQIAGVSYSRAGDWRRKESFRKAEAIAHKISVWSFESMAAQMALGRIIQLKFHNGKPIIDPRTGQPYYEVQYFPKMVEFMLRAHAPNRYKERSESTVHNKISNEPEQGDGVLLFMRQRALAQAEADREGNGNGKHDDSS